ncbi:MAG: helix-turn-helix transcriptional regulator [Lachnospiraceae bacterium]|nr:helix-turn-helix transcriptional regulator [Lachnospiraceae bacterium]
MQHPRAEFDILNKITEEREKRNWTEYTLAKNSDLTQSTISSWYRKNMEPSIASIEKICHGLGITMSQFFSSSPEGPDFTPDQQELFALWVRLNASQKDAILQMIHSFIDK